MPFYKILKFCAGKNKFQNIYGALENCWNYNLEGITMYACINESFQMFFVINKAI